MSSKGAGAVRPNTGSELDEQVRTGDVPTVVELFATPFGDGHSWVPAEACTLRGGEQPLRVAEFGRLFATSLQHVQRLAPTRLRLDLTASAEDTARDLVARETNCCAFFTFTLTPTGTGTVQMDIEVPAGHRAVLDGLANQAATALGA